MDNDGEEQNRHIDNIKRAFTMIVCKMDVLEALKKAGYSASHLRDEKLLSEAAIQKLRQGKMVTISNLDTICRLLYLQPGDVIGMLWDENDAFIPNEAIKGSHWPSLFRDGKPINNKLNQSMGVMKIQKWRWRKLVFSAV